MNIHIFVHTYMQSKCVWRFVLLIAWDWDSLVLGHVFFQVGGWTKDIWWLEVWSMIPCGMEKWKTFETSKKEPAAFNRVPIHWWLNIYYNPASVRVTTVMYVIVHWVTFDISNWWFFVTKALMAYRHAINEHFNAWAYPKLNGELPYSNMTVTRDRNWGAQYIHATLYRVYLASIVVSQSPIINQ